jgi:hypothetical protein
MIGKRIGKKTQDNGGMLMSLGNPLHLIHPQLKNYRNIMIALHAEFLDVQIIAKGLRMSLVPVRKTHTLVGIDQQAGRSVRIAGVLYVALTFLII